MSDPRKHKTNTIDQVGDSSAEELDTRIVRLVELVSENGANAETLTDAEPEAIARILARMAPTRTHTPIPFKEGTRVSETGTNAKESAERFDVTGLKPSQFWYDSDSDRESGDDVPETRS